MTTPESEDGPEYLHEWKPNPGRDDLEHQIVLRETNVKKTEIRNGSKILGIIPMM